MTNEQITETLSNLQMNETATIETIYGTVTVQKIWHGAEAWISGANIPQVAIGVRAHTPLEAFHHQLEVGKRFAATLAVDEALEETAMRSQFTALAYALCFAASLRYAARFYRVTITAQNFDKTLFSTSTGGTINHQTFYYPADSNEIYGACDCLRFRTNGEVCEHLSYIALTEIFASAFYPAEVAA